MNKSVEATTQKIEIAYEQLRFEAGHDASAIIAAIQPLAVGIPQNRQASNISAEGLSPTRVTYAKVARDKATNAGKAIIVFQIPSMEDLMANPEGAAFIQSAIETALLRRVTVAWGGMLARNNLDGYTIPATVSDFVTEAESASGTGVRRFPRAIWNKYAKGVCDILRKQVKLVITDVELERVFSNTAYAKQVYPNIPQTFWTDQVLAVLLQRAPFEFEVKHKETGVITKRIDEGDLFKHWAATRDDATFAADLQLDALDFGASE